MKGCPDEQFYNFKFLNFNLSDVDTVCIKSFAQNTNFQKVEDSLLKYFYKEDSVYYFNVENSNGKFDLKKDYKIFLGNRMVYEVTNIQTKQSVCNQCFPFGTQDYKHLNNYQVNGSLVVLDKNYSTDIVIKK